CALGRHPRHALQEISGRRVRRPVRAHHRQTHRRHGSQGQLERRAARLRRPRLIGPIPMSTPPDDKTPPAPPSSKKPLAQTQTVTTRTPTAIALEETLLWLCSVPSPIGEEKELCTAVADRLSRVPLPSKIRRYGDSIVVPLSRKGG